MQYAYYSYYYSYYYDPLYSQTFSPDFHRGTRRGVFSRGFETECFCKLPPPSASFEGNTSVKIPTLKVLK